jgi:hypothetical protein
LEERERAFKKARTEKQKEETETRQANEKIKEEGKRLREEKERELSKKQETEMQKQVHTDALDVDAPPSTGRLYLSECLANVDLVFRCSGYDSPNQISSQNLPNTKHATEHICLPLPLWGDGEIVDCSFHDSERENRR